MTKFKKIVISIFVLLEFFTFAANVLAIEHKLFRCSKYIVTMMKDHSVPSNSEKYTSTAINDLNYFRAHRLSNFNHNPSSTSIVANHQSSKKKKQAATSRLSALLKEGSSSYQIDENTQEGIKQTLIGSSYNGADNILAHLKDRKKQSKLFKSENKFELLRQDVLSYIGNPMISASLFFISLYPNILTPLLVGPNRGEPESMIRSFKLKYYGQNDETIMMKFLKKIKSSFWVYRSADFLIPQKVSKKISSTGMLEMMDLMDFWDDFIAPRITYKYTSERFINIHHTPEKQSWARVDELLYYDKKAQEPVLLVFLRLTEKIPPYPKTAPIKKKKEVLEGLADPI